MEQLKVIGTEDDKLVLATESGERFSLAVDDVLRVELRKARRDRDGDVQTPRAEPARDPGPHPRRAVGARGRRAARRPRRGRRPLRRTRARRARARRRTGARGARAARRRPRGRRSADLRLRRARQAGRGRRHRRALDQLERADRLDRQARVHRERRRPRRALGLRSSPQHAVAAELRRDPALSAGFAARGTDPAPARAGRPCRRRTTRASTAARSARAGLPDADIESPEIPAPAAPAVQEAAIKRADEPVVTSAETADLLEALRRRRGQREPLPGAEEAAAPQRSSAPGRAVRRPRAGLRRGSRRRRAAGIRCPGRPLPLRWRRPAVARGAPRCRRGTRSSSAPAPSD